jgi:hypothetical protein
LTVGTPVSGRRALFWKRIDRQETREASSSSYLISYV